MYLLHNMNTSFLTKKEKMPQKNRHLLLFFYNAEAAVKLRLLRLCLFQKKFFCLKNTRAKF